MSGDHIQSHLNTESPLIEIEPAQKIISVLILALSLAFNDIRNPLKFNLILICIICFVFVSIPSINYLLRRMYVIIPFILFAFLLPFISKSGTTIYLYKDIAIYQNGLFEMSNILLKSIAGVSMAVALSATTSQFDIVKGLEKLKLPKIFVAILSFALRYISVYISEFKRVKLSMKSRGFNSKSLTDSVAIAYAGSAMLIRGFERGEKVYSSMIARGFDGNLFITSKKWNQSKLLYFLCITTLLVNILGYFS